MGLLSCDATKNYLKPFGYGTLALPKANFPVLTLLSKRGDRLTPLGPLAGTFPPGAATLPQTTRARTSSISGSASSNINASIGLDILGTVIGALSGSTLGIKAAYKNAKTVKFEFGDVMENRADIAALDQYLSAVTFGDEVGNFMKQALEKDAVYCVVATVDATQVSVSATKDGGADLSLDVPAVQGLVGGKVAVGGTAASSSVLTYTAKDVPLIFGAQVVQLVYDDGLYQTLKLVKASDTVLAAASASTTKALTDPSGAALIALDGEIEG